MTIPWSSISGFLASWGLLIAIVGFIATLVIIPIIVVALPDDYFVRSRRVKHNPQQISITRVVLVFAKNIFGAMLIIAGAMMLILPGQGLLTILLGLMLTNFPGKYALERKLVGMKSVSKSINWIRDKAGKNPMTLPL